MYLIKSIFFIYLTFAINGLTKVDVTSCRQKFELSRQWHSAFSHLSPTLPPPSLYPTPTSYSIVTQSV